MTDFTKLASSEPMEEDTSSTLMKNVHFTHNETIIHPKLYRILSEKLTILEKSVEITKVALNIIKKEANTLDLTLEEKEDISLRLNWLFRLVEIQDTLSFLTYKEDAERTSLKLSSVPNYPLKEKLNNELDKLTKTLNSEPCIEVKKTDAEKLMEIAFDQVGDAFINLGKEGREHVVKKVLEEFGEKASTEQIQEQTNELENSAAILKAMSNPIELVVQLETLPFKSFQKLTSDDKQKLAIELLSTNEWHGLANLSRLVYRLIEKANLQETQTPITTVINVDENEDSLPAYIKLK